MNTKNYLDLLALTTATLFLNIMTLPAQSVDSVEALKNSAVAASPRAKEVFPWLARAPSQSTVACCAQAAARNELTEAKKNRALASSPRTLEQFPELAHTAEQHLRFTVAPLVEKNTAVLSSPRIREEFPSFSRRPTPGTARGGAAKLDELRR